MLLCAVTDRMVEQKMTPSARVINNHLVVQTTNPGQIRAVFPKVKEATIKGQQVCAIPFTLESARVLTNMGIPSPSPIRTQYDWPGIYKPMAHQIHTAEFMTLYQRCFTLNGMGSAKTLSALWAADYMQRTEQVNKVMVVAPLSTLDPTWGNEIFRNFPLKRFAILHGSRQKRLDLLKTKQDIFVINHDGVEVIYEELMKREDIDLIIMDECFPAGTEVSTPSGKKCIETLVLNDVVCTSWGARPITHVFQKMVSKLVRLHFEDGTSVECTPTHPFATEKGWIHAEDCEGLLCLNEQGAEDLRALWDRVRSHKNVPKTQSGEILQSKVWSKIQRTAVQDSGLRVPRWTFRGMEILRGLWRHLFCSSFSCETPPTANLFSDMREEIRVGEQPQHAQGGEESREDQKRADTVEQRSAWTSFKISHILRGAHRNLQEKSRGQRNRHGQSRGYTSSTYTDWVAIQFRNIFREANAWISYQLQSGLWVSLLSDCNRSGRQQSQQHHPASAGQEERSETRYSRVVRVENIELRGPERVWNIEIAGPHDYVAGGRVVHNCAVYRNQRTGRWKTMNAVVNKCGFPRSVWGLTGAPTPNEPTDAFAQMKLIKPENYKGHFTTFKNETMFQLTQFKWVPRKGSEEAVNRILKPSIRYALEDCVDLPETIYSDRYVALSSEQNKHYRELINQAMTEIRGSAVTAVNAAVLVSKVIQAACGVLIGADGALLKIDVGPRMAVVKELIEECPQKVIVFVPFTGALRTVAAELAKKWSVEVIDGSVSVNKRNKIFQDFRQAPNPHIIVANAAAMSHGLTLTEASRIIWFAPAFSNDVYNQANARIVRPGQKHVTHIVHIYATAEERKIYNVLKEKGRMQDAVLELAKEGR